MKNAEAMQNQDKKSKDVLPESFSTREEFSEFWDTHSTADYEEVMEPVEVEIDLASSKIYCPVAKDLLLQIRQEARKQGVSTETLINLYLREKLLASAALPENNESPSKNLPEESSKAKAAARLVVNFPGKLTVWYQEKPCSRLLRPPGRSFFPFSSTPGPICWLVVPCGGSRFPFCRKNWAEISIWTRSFASAVFRWSAMEPPVTGVASRFGVDQIDAHPAEVK